MSFYSETIQFFNDVSEFQNSGIYNFFKEVFAQFIIYTTISAIKFKIYAMTFAWDIAKEILNQLNISSLLSAAWSNIDSKTASIIGYFKIPEAINIILSAKVTKFVLRFVGM